MHATPLFLSHWDASIPISVPANVVADLKKYHVMGVRFLYDCFRKMQTGAILNHENGMNFPIQISAFFNALHTFITPQSPVLIVCAEESLNAWHYHLTNHGGFVVTLLSSKNCEEILNGEVHRVILATVDSAKLLREIKQSDFFAVVVEELDKVTTKTIIKQLKSQFNIGLTNRNFLKHPDQKMFWTMLKWSNPSAVGKFDEFCQEDTNHLLDLRYPYGTWWQRLTWKFCESFKVPSNEEEKQYRRELQQWSARNRTFSAIPKPEVKRQTRKRKLAENAIKTETKEEPFHFHLDDENPNISDDTKNILNVSNSPKSHYQNIQNSPIKENNLIQNLTDSKKLDQHHSQDLNSSQETVIYDFKNCLSSDIGEDSILTSIMGSFDNPKVARASNEFEADVNEKKGSLSEQDVLSTLSKSQTHNIHDDDDDNILTSILTSKSVDTQEIKTQDYFGNSSLTNTLEKNNSQNSDSRKNDILSLLYGETE